MSNDITSSSNDTNNLNDEEDNESEDDDDDKTKTSNAAGTNEPDALKDNFKTLKSILLYALFLFAKITCIILINANILFFLTYLFERIYYKKFTLGNMDKKKKMIDDYNAYLDATFPSDRTQAPYKNGVNGFKENRLLTCPIDYEKAAKEAAALSKIAKDNSGTGQNFTCKKGADGKQQCNTVTAAGAGGPAGVQAGGPAGAAAGAAAGAPGGGVQAAAPAGGPAAGAPGGGVQAGGPAAGAPGGVVQAGGQKGGVGANIIKNINELSKKIIDGIKPINKVTKNIADLYDQSNNSAGADEAAEAAEADETGEALADDIDTAHETKDPICPADKLRKVNLTSCKMVACKGEFPHNLPTPNNMFGDYLRIRLACIGKTQIAINNKIKNTIKSFNNLLPAFCYCTKEETDYISGKETVMLRNPTTGKYEIPLTPEKENSEEFKKIYKEEPDAIEINCKVRKEFYNGILMVFGFLISIFYLIYCDLYVNITLFVNHILLWFQITNKANKNIETTHRRLLQFLIFLMTPFIFITNRVVACLIMLQLTYRLWIKPLFNKSSKEKVYKLIIENRNIVAYMFVFSYLLLLYTIQIPANYELPVKIIPTLVVTIIIIIAVIQWLYRVIKNLKFAKETCTKL